MKIKITKKEFSEFYNRAKKAFKGCIEKPENDFLDEQIDFSLREINYKESYISFQFSESDCNKFIMESNLSLHAPNGEEFGYYCLHVDENGETVDDFLVFE